MTSVLLFLVAFTLFALSSRGLIMALTENIGLLRYTEDFSPRALRVGKVYKIIAWSILTLFLFAMSIQTFLTVFFTF